MHIPCVARFAKIMAYFIVACNTCQQLSFLQHCLLVACLPFFSLNTGLRTTVSGDCGGGGGVIALH